MKYDFSPGELEKCESRIINAFGLALKAGKCAVGSEKCVEEILDGREWPVCFRL